MTRSEPAGVTMLTESLKVGKGLKLIQVRSVGLVLSIQSRRSVLPRLCSEAFLLASHAKKPP